MLSYCNLNQAFVFVAVRKEAVSDIIESGVGWALDGRSRDAMQISNQMNMRLHVSRRKVCTDFVVLEAGGG